MNDLTFHFTDKEGRQYQFRLYRNGLEELCVEIYIKFNGMGTLHGCTTNGRLELEMEFLSEEPRRFLERVVANLAFA